MFLAVSNFTLSLVRVFTKQAYHSDPISCVTKIKQFAFMLRPALWFNLSVDVDLPLYTSSLSFMHYWFNKAWFQHYNTFSECVYWCVYVFVLYFHVQTRIFVDDKHLFLNFSKSSNQRGQTQQALQLGWTWLASVSTSRPLQSVTQEAHRAVNSITLYTCYIHLVHCHPEDVKNHL